MAAKLKSVYICSSCGYESAKWNGRCPSCGTSMFRQIMTADIMEKTFEGAPAEMAAEYSKVMGISLEVFDKDVSIAAGVLIVLGAGVLSLALGALATKYARRTDR